MIEAVVNKTHIQVVMGVITEQEVDAVVNAASNPLTGGGGVDGAIHQAGGPAILAECLELNGCETGDAKITTAGEMPAKHVIHTVGPVYFSDCLNSPGLLASCYRRCMEVASENGLKSIAVPAVSTGVYAYPMDEAATIAIETVCAYAKAHDDIELVRFVQFGESAYETYASEFQRVTG